MLLRLRVLLKNKSGLDVSILSARCYSSKTFSSTSRGGGSGGGTAVMSFGDGSHGALGLGSSSILGVGDDAYEPMQIPGLPPHITSIGAGHYHSLAVTAGGEVWAWGRDNEAQLGRGSSPLPRDSWNEPKMVQGLNQVRVKEVCASGVVSAAIGEDGSLWVWGKSKRGQLGLGNGVIEASLPSRVKALDGEEIAKVSLGWGHAIAQTKDGKVFGWGYSADGRLGKIGIAIETSKAHQILSEATSRPTGKPSSSSLEVAEKLVLEQMEKENDMPIIWEPCLLQELRDVPVSDVSCGLDHSLILRSDGLLLSGGSNTYGQLGRDTEDLGLLPVEMNFQPLSVSSGLGHSLALCQMKSPEAAGEINGIVTWGWNRNSQLGRQGLDNIPSLVEGLEGETPVSVSGGRVHSVALTCKGEVWVWGCGKSGRLGLGSSADESEPALLEYLQDFEVLQVVSGFDHNLVLVNTRVTTWPCA